MGSILCGEMMMHCHWQRCFLSQPYLLFLCDNQSNKGQCQSFRDRVLACGEPIPPSLTRRSSPSWPKKASHFTIAGFTIWWKIVLWCDFSLSPLFQSQILYVHVPTSLLGILLWCCIIFYENGMIVLCLCKCLKILIYARYIHLM